MAVQFTCPVCKSPIIVRFLKLGEMAKCRQCDGLVRVPEDAVEVDSNTDYPEQTSLRSDFFGRQFDRSPVEILEPSPQELTEEEEEQLGKAQKLVTYAVRAGIVVCILSFLVTTMALISDSTTLASYADPLTYLDVLAIAALTYGVHRRSRYAAAMLILFYLLSVAVTALATNAAASRAVGILLFTTLFVLGLIGSIKSHRLLKKAGRLPKRLSRWLVIPANVILLTVLTLASFGLLAEAGYFPEDRVVPGDEISRHIRSTLEKWGIFAADEEIIYFYSAGNFSVLSDGNFFTEERVASYAEIEEGVWMSQARYENIKSIELVSYPIISAENKTVFEITLFDGDHFRIWAPAAYGQDSVFFSTMLDLWEGKKRNAVAPSKL